MAEIYTKREVNAIGCMWIVKLISGLGILIGFGLFIHEACKPVEAISGKLLAGYAAAAVFCALCSMLVNKASKDF